MYPKARTPSSVIKSPQARHLNYIKPELPSEKKQKNKNKNKRLKKLSVVKHELKHLSPKITRCGSESPIEVITFLEECENEALTDDWSKSLLYQKVKSSESTELAFTESEMKAMSRKPPREKENIERIMHKGLSVLRCLLLELLGTKEDMLRFEEKFNGSTNVYVRALMERCLSLLQVRNLTLEILELIEKREKIMKNLKVSKNKVKEKVLRVFYLNQDIRGKLLLWKENDCVPFQNFVFKGKDYLNKISEDSVTLQGYLEKVADHKGKFNFDY